MKRTKNKPQKDNNPSTNSSLMGYFLFPDKTKNTIEFLDKNSIPCYYKMEKLNFENFKREIIKKEDCVPFDKPDEIETEITEGDITFIQRYFRGQVLTNNKFKSNVYVKQFKQTLFPQENIKPFNSFMFIPSYAPLSFVADITLKKFKDIKSNKWVRIIQIPINHNIFNKYEILLILAHISSYLVKSYNIIVEAFYRIKTIFLRLSYSRLKMDAKICDSNSFSTFGLQECRSYNFQNIPKNDGEKDLYLFKKLTLKRKFVRSSPFHALRTPIKNAFLHAEEYKHKVSLQNVKITKENIKELLDKHVEQILSYEVQSKKLELLMTFKKLYLIKWAHENNKEIIQEKTDKDEIRISNVLSVLFKKNPKFIDNFISNIVKVECKIYLQNRLLVEQICLKQKFSQCYPNQKHLISSSNKFTHVIKDDKYDWLNFQQEYKTKIENKTNNMYSRLLAYSQGKANSKEKCFFNALQSLCKKILSSEETSRQNKFNVVKTQKLSRNKKIRIE